MDSVLRIREITVKSCKTYFILVDLLRYEDFKNLSEDSLKRQLNAFDHVEDLKKDEKFYSSKAMLFFQLKNVSFIAAGN